MTRASEHGGRDVASGALRWEAFCHAAGRLTGVDLLQYRREQTERRVRALAKRRGADDLTGYLVLLRRSDEERALFRDRVTINVSQLWRNPKHWQTLTDTALTALARMGRTMNAWSVGCSYGAEPYTIAMAWRQVAQDRPIRILGTDIDETSIARARRGHFSDEDVRDVPFAARDRWLVRVDDEWSVRDDLRRFVRFEVADVFAPVVRASQDLVVCRNMVIYMTPARRDEVHRLLARTLRPGGWLMIGATERITAPAELGLEPVHPFIYRKCSGSEVPR